MSAEIARLTAQNAALKRQLEAERVGRVVERVEEASDKEARPALLPELILYIVSYLKPSSRTLANLAMASKAT